MKTRNSDHIYLIGNKDLEILSRLDQPPTILQVLRRFHFHLDNLKVVQSACHATISELINDQILTKNKYNYIKKLKRYHTQWLLLKKNKLKNCPNQRNKEFKFLSNVQKHFDENFLYENPDKGHIAVLAKKSIKEEINENSADENNEDSSDEYIPAKKTYVKKNLGNRSSYQLYTLPLLSALDRHMISDRKATQIVIPIIKALGHDPSELSISKSTIKRKRRNARIDYANKIKTSLDKNRPFVVHWDSKIIEDIKGSRKVDRLAVLVSADGEDKLLGVPKLSYSTGKEEASAVSSLLHKWDLQSNVIGMSFDTTAANTGQFNGACICLEKEIGRPLFWLACRHHILEIILSKVFQICFGPSTSPDIPLFKRFKDVWEKIDKNLYRGIDEKSYSGLRKENLEWINSLSIKDTYHPRDDYLELIELTGLILGKKYNKVHWQYPGAVHRARWMAKLIYAMKIFLFRDQSEVNLSREELDKITRFVKFGVLIYTKYWISAPLAAEAAINDLNLWIKLKKYNSVDREISKLTTQVLERHLWYVSDELVGLSIFSEQISLEEKSKIINSMLNKDYQEKRCVRGDAATLNRNVNLSQLTNKRSKYILNDLKISTSFFSLPPEYWSTNADYIAGKQIVLNLKVINDTAERGIKLFDEYNKVLTNNEEEKQLVLQIIEANRKSLTKDATKAAITEYANSK